MNTNISNNIKIYKEMIFKCAVNFFWKPYISEITYCNSPNFSQSKHKGKSPTTIK